VVDVNRLNSIAQQLAAGVGPDLEAKQRWLHNESTPEDWETLPYILADAAANRSADSGAAHKVRWGHTADLRQMKPERGVKAIAVRATIAIPGLELVRLADRVRRGAPRGERWRTSLTAKTLSVPRQRSCGLWRPHTVPTRLPLPGK